MLSYITIRCAAAVVNMPYCINLFRAPEPRRSSTRCVRVFLRDPSSGPVPTTHGSRFCVRRPFDSRSAIPTRGHSRFSRVLFRADCALVSHRAQRTRFVSSRPPVSRYLIISVARPMSAVRIEPSSPASTCFSYARLTQCDPLRNNNLLSSVPRQRTPTRDDFELLRNSKYAFRTRVVQFVPPPYNRRPSAAAPTRCRQPIRRSRRECKCRMSTRRRGIRRSGSTAALASWYHQLSGRTYGHIFVCLHFVILLLALRNVTFSIICV